MRVCLIRPPSPELLNDRIDPPMGLLYIGTSLEQAGHTVTLLDFAGGQSPDIPDADVYGLSLFTTAYPEALVIRDQIRAKSTAPIMVGGPHAEALPRETARDFDYVVVGEAEAELPDLIEPIASRRLDKQVIFVKRPENLDALSINNYDLVDMTSYSREMGGQRAFSVLSGRGCPYRCVYCYTAALGGKVRFRSVDHLMSELDTVDRRYGMDGLRFIDDNFLMSRRFFKSLAPVLKEFDKPYRVYCRAADLTPDRCELLAESGCRMAASGVETGSQVMHDRMNTRKNVEQMAEGIRAARDNGIDVRVGLIVGYPGETWDTVRESVENLKKMDFNSYNLFNFVPLPGTDPYRNPKKYGIKWLSDDWKNYYVMHGDNEGSYAFEHETLTRRDLRDMREFMIEELNKTFLPAQDDLEYK